MTEVTRVPLQPIAKGSLTKLWIGVVLAVLVAAGMAFAALPKGLNVETLRDGTGPAPEMGQVVFVNYTGKLTDGEVFDESGASPFPPGVLPEGTPMLLEEGRLIPGFIAGLLQMEKGGLYKLYIPADQAYGAEPPPGAPIPPNADLVFDVEVVDVMSREDVEQRIIAIQQMMGAQRGQPGGQPGAPAAPPPGQ